MEIILYFTLVLVCFIATLYFYPRQFMEGGWEGDVLEFDCERFIGGLYQLRKTNRFSIFWVIRFFLVFPLDFG